jgi:hypothetical protein
VHTATPSSHLLFSCAYKYPYQISPITSQIHKAQFMIQLLLLLSQLNCSCSRSLDNNFISFASSCTHHQLLSAYLQSESSSLNIANFFQLMLFFLLLRLGRFRLFSDVLNFSVCCMHAHMIAWGGTWKFFKVRRKLCSTLVCNGTSLVI